MNFITRYLRKQRILRKAEKGTLSDAGWRQAIEEGILPEQYCPICGRQIPIDKEVIQRDHAECIVRHSVKQELGPWDM